MFCGNQQNCWHTICNFLYLKETELLLRIIWHLPAILIPIPLIRMRTTSRHWSLMAACAIVLVAATHIFAQAGFNDGRVMLQGFYWESSRHGYEKFPQFGSKKWYEIVQEKAPEIREGRFQLIWLPPPSYAGGYSAGYDPKEYYDLSNSYGNTAQHRKMLEALLKNGVEPIADIVINHRNGRYKWADFKNPDWGTWAVTRYDECFENPDSEVKGTPESNRGAPEESPTYRSEGDYAYGDFRDIDHMNKTVRKDIIRYLLLLKSYGYRGWRYDMVHGYNAKWLAQYNLASQPTFSVGEYDWEKQGEQRGWIWASSTHPEKSGNQRLEASSSVFDFQTQFTLKDNKGNYTALYGYGHGTGLMGDTTDNLGWKNRAVTFLENHDTGYRTNEDGSINGRGQDSFANGWEVEQGYAYILTHPGVPTVYWKHYFDWGTDLKSKITALINARLVAGVTSGSEIYQQDNAKHNGVYAAAISGRNGMLYVRIGKDNDAWNPAMSGYSDYRQYAHGVGWTVWVKLPGNPQVKQASLASPLPIPKIQDVNSIEIADTQLSQP